LPLEEQLEAGRAVLESDPMLLRQELDIDGIRV
jgi:hypothetical protein